MGQGPHPGWVFVHGTTMWHRVALFDGVYHTLCGRLFQASAQTKDRIHPFFMCQTCRKGMR